MKKQILPIDENVDTKNFVDRSGLAKLYYEPKKTADEPQPGYIVNVKIGDIFIPAMGLTLPFATITAITVYLFRTPLDLIPFVLIFFVFLAMFVLMGTFYTSYRKVDNLFERMNISISSLLLISAAIVAIVSFVFYTFILNYLGEYSLVIFLVFIDISGAFALTSLAKLATKR